MKIDIATFTRQGDGAVRTGLPWAHRDYTVATDGAMAVAAPSANVQDDFARHSEDDGVIAAIAGYFEYFGGGVGQKGYEIKVVPCECDVHVCQACYGTGYIYSSECPECDGRGMIKKSTPRAYPFGPVCSWFMWRIMSLSCSANGSGVVFGVPDDFDARAAKPIYFYCGEALGFVMPVNQLHKNGWAESREKWASYPASNEFQPEWNPPHNPFLPTTDTTQGTGPRPDGQSVKQGSRSCRE